jgi:hypothetical protein
MSLLRMLNGPIVRVPLTVHAVYAAGTRQASMMLLRQTSGLGGWVGGACAAFYGQQVVIRDGMSRTSAWWETCREININRQTDSHTDRQAENWRVRVLVPLVERMPAERLSGLPPRRGSRPGQLSDRYCRRALP